jgi:hypothetical protein
VAAWLATPTALERIRAAYEGDLLLLKGPEVAAIYPDPVLRSYGDLDLLVSDSQAAQRALIAAGFEPLSHERRYVDLHHLRPLRVPGLPLKVEVHHAPKWPAGLEAPSSAELIAAGVPGRCEVEGVLGLPPALHAIVLAAHAWAHAPLGKLRQLLDIALVAEAAQPGDLTSVAARWGVSRVWDTTVRALHGLFGGSRSPVTLRLWARHLAAVRERTVFETHFRSWVSPLWSFAGSEGLKYAASAFEADLRPSAGERWQDKLVRTRLALANGSVSASRHDALLQELGLERRGGETMPRG